MAARHIWRCGRIVSFLISMALLLRADMARADDTSALINHALDTQVKLTLNNIIPAAMDVIARQTGVRIEVDPMVYDLLPWGQETNINAKIENQTLREALGAITRKLGLTFTVGDESLRLEPMAALRRLGRRSTIEELGSLDKLVSTPLDLANNHPTIKQLVEAVDARLEAIKAPYAIENRLGDAVRQDEAISVARNATLMEALESMSKQASVTWYPWGKFILIVSKSDQIRRELGRPITVQYNGVDLAQVLTELQKRSGVKLDIEPGAIQQVPPESRLIHLRIDNGTVQDALDAVDSLTGLDYAIKDTGIYVWNRSNLATAHDPVIGLITLPESGIQLMLRESQVPADIRQYIQALQQKELDKMRQLMVEQGFKPTPRPVPTTNPDM